MRVSRPNRYIADAKFCFCKNNKRIIIIQLTRALHIRERRQCRVVGETEELMEESNIVGLSDFPRGACHLADF